MKRRMAAILLCAFLFQSTTALCEYNELKDQILNALFPSCYGSGFSSYSILRNMSYDEPEPTLRELSDLVIYPDEDEDVYYKLKTAGKFNSDVLSCNDGFLSFGGTGGWAYVNARCYPDHNSTRENLFLYIGLRVHGIGDRIVDTPEIVIRLKNRDKTKPISIKKLEVEIVNQRRYIFNNAVQQNDNCIFSLGNTGRRLLQDMAKEYEYEYDKKPDIIFRIYFDTLYFMGSDLSAYPYSIVDNLKSGEPYVVGDKMDYNFQLKNMAQSLVGCYVFDSIHEEILQNADMLHNATFEDLTKTE